MVEKDPEESKFDVDTAAKYIELVKKDLGINKSNDQLNDVEICMVIREIAGESVAAFHVEGKSLDYGQLGIDLMNMLALHFWPKFFLKIEISQQN